MLNALWLGFFLTATVAALAQWLLAGNAQVFAAMVQALFAMAKLSVEVMVLLFGTLSLWLGFLRIAERAGLVETLARWLDTGKDDNGREVVLLDTRNIDEVVHGSFRNALIFPINRFTDLPKAVDMLKPELEGKTIVSFCTGGIRCEKSVLRMQADGYENCYQLEGGILGYFEKVGGRHYDGRCFVFDDRIALDPTLDPLIDDIGF